MTSLEKLVADTLIKVGKGLTYEAIYGRVASVGNISAEEVKEIAERLSDDHVLWKRGGPANNLAAGGTAGTTLAAAWFERGGAWPKG